jgi:hypothetical protein
MRFVSGGAERLILVAERRRIPRQRSSIESDAGGILGFLVARHLAAEWELENIVVAPLSASSGAWQTTPACPGGCGPRNKQ